MDDVFKFSMSSLQVNSILRHVAELMKYETDEQLEELYHKTAWAFDKKYKKSGAAYEAFKHAVAWAFILLCSIPSNQTA